LFLASNEPNDLAKYAKAHALISGIRSTNRTISEGHLIDPYPEEKIRKIEMGFSILSGVGDDSFTPQQGREYILDALYDLKGMIGRDEMSLDPPRARLSRMNESASE